MGASGAIFGLFFVHMCFAPSELLGLALIWRPAWQWGCSLLVLAFTVYSLAHCLDSEMQDIWAVCLGVYFPPGHLSGRRCAEFRFDM